MRRLVSCLYYAALIIHDVLCANNAIIWFIHEKRGTTLISAHFVCIWILFPGATSCRYEPIVDVNIESPNESPRLIGWVERSTGFNQEIRKVPVIPQNESGRKIIYHSAGARACNQCENPVTNRFLLSQMSLQLRLSLSPCPRSVSHLLSSLSI